MCISSIKYKPILYTVCETVPYIGVSHAIQKTGKIVAAGKRNI